jgi:hypothetical protein
MNISEEFPKYKGIIWMFSIFLLIQNLSLYKVLFNFIIDHFEWFQMHKVLVILDYYFAFAFFNLKYKCHEEK